MIEDARHAQPRPGTTGAAFRRGSPISPLLARMARDLGRCPILNCFWLTTSAIVPAMAANFRPGPSSPCSRRKVFLRWFSRRQAGYAGGRGEVEGLGVTYGLDLESQTRLVLWHKRRPWVMMCCGPAPRGFSKCTARLPRVIGRPVTVTSELSYDDLDCLCDCGSALQSALVWTYNVTAINARDVRNHPVIVAIIYDTPGVAFVCLAKFQLEAAVLRASNADAV
jgi:hypothetical protein